jgi:biopolymer transport protein ExbD
VSVSVGGPKGGKKDLNNDLMLTPFIDLLSTLVCFLLISAVWTQVANLDIKQSHGTASGTPRQAAELDISLGAPGSATFVLKKSGKTLQSVTVKQATTKELVREMGLLTTKLRGLPAMKDSAIESALVAPHALATHGDMVAVLDGLRISGVSNIGVKQTGGK